ncbi:kWG [Anopheles sinensis]|uniref:KWG n=1 Tax=Anopheles sinensis TaxID=74873 RepID=A0A084VJL1_ANOSI|nr:kWG [Anopheles sinensis]
MLDLQSVKNFGKKDAKIILPRGSAALRRYYHQLQHRNHFSMQAPTTLIVLTILISCELGLFTYNCAKIRSRRSQSHDRLTATDWWRIGCPRIRHTMTPPRVRDEGGGWAIVKNHDRLSRPDCGTSSNFHLNKMISVAESSTIRVHPHDGYVKPAAHKLEQHRK